MMKKKLSYLMVAVAAATMVWAPTVIGHGNKPGTATLTIGGGEVKVDFVGPESKGRDVLALLPPGAYWRMGADKATTLSTTVDLKFGDMTVPKGDYTLVAHFSDDKQWSLIVADAVGSGGKPTTVIGKSEGSISKLDSEVMNMTIKLEESGGKAELILEWGTARLVAQFAAA